MSKELMKKLEKKFQNLSRSKESIQSLSLWIMYHKDNYEEIVAQWLIGISNDCNTLPMFYVANEVIQGCGKKKCPEYREAFSKILVEAVSYEHVKEIKDKIFRLITLWKERNIFDEEFYQSVTNKLNNVEEEESSTEESEDEEELSEQQVIKQFEKQTLIDKLRKFKCIALKTKEKEDIVIDADIPELPDVNRMLVKADCHEALKKCSTYINLANDLIPLFNKELSTRRKLLKELDRNCIFYAAQQKDVKEVANAFRVYGKRVKSMENRVNEKLASFPLPVISPCFSDDTSMSPNIGLNYDTDDSSRNFLCKKDYSNQDFHSASTSKEGLSLTSKVTSEDIIFKNFKPSQEKSTKETTLDFSDLLNKTAQIEGRIKCKSQRIDFEKQTLSFGSKINTETKQTDSKEIVKETKHVSVKLKDSPEISKMEDDSCISETQTTLIESNTTLKIQTGTNLKSNEKSGNKQNKSNGEIDDIDLLLEESFDKRSQIKVNYKRKIELLMKAKSKKHCSEQDQEVKEKISTMSDLSQLTVKEIPQAKNNEDICKNEFNQTEKNQNETDNIISKNLQIVVKIESEDLREITEELSPQTNIKTARSLTKSIPDNTKPDSGDKLHTVNTPLRESSLSTETMSFNTNATFTGIPMLSFMSSDMHANEAKQAEDENMPYDPSELFSDYDSNSALALDNSSETSKKTEEDHLPKDTNTGTVLPSCLLELSTDFLKNILQNNQQNTLVIHKIDNPSEIVSQSPNNPTSTEETPSMLTSKLSNNDSSENSENSRDNLKIEARSIVKTSEKILLENMELNKSYLSSAEKKEQLNAPESTANAEKTSTPSNLKQNISSNDLKPNTVSGVLDKKPNLLETLKSVLVCLSENMQSNCNIKSENSAKHIKLEPPLPMEDLLKIYGYLHGGICDAKTEMSDKTTIPNVNNYEVMDMECDSGGEM